MRNDAIARTDDCKRAMKCCDKQELIVQFGGKSCHCLSCGKICHGCSGDFFEGVNWGGANDKGLRRQ